MFQGDLSALGFWIFIAAIVVGGMWKESRQNAEKHETLRRIVEKTGEIDEAKLKELFSEAPSEESKPGYGYRAARVTGTIVFFIGAGIATFILIAVGLGKAFGATRLLDDVTGTASLIDCHDGYFCRHRDARPGHILLLSLLRTASRHPERTADTLGGQPSRGRRSAEGARYPGDRTCMRR